MYRNLFQNALKIEDPYFIKDIEFDSDSKMLDIWLDFKIGSTFDCPQCHKPDCSIHDTKERTWRHLNFFQPKAYLHCRVPRIKCEDCGVHQYKAPWARKQSGFTLLMDALITIMAQSMPISKVAEMIGEHDTRVWRVVDYYVKEARSKEDFSDVSTIGVDETSLADVDKSKVIHVCKGKDSSTITTFYNDFKGHGGCPSDIKSVCCDMSPAFIKGVSDTFPNASIVFDKFHVMKMVNEAVDAVRRQEQLEHKILKKTRYTWLKNPENLTKYQIETLNDLKNMNLKTVRAYNIRLTLQDFWKIEDRETAEIFLKKWYFWTTHSRLQPIINKAKSIKKHWEGVMNYHDSRINKGLLEGLNSIVQSLKRSARGYRNPKNFMIMIYLRLGKLEFNLPT
jgi:transposase